MFTRDITVKQMKVLPNGVIQYRDNAYNYYFKDLRSGSKTYEKIFDRDPDQNGAVLLNINLKVVADTGNTAVIA